MAGAAIVFAALGALMVMVLALVSYPILAGFGQGPQMQTFYAPSTEDGLQLEITLSTTDIPTGGSIGAAVFIYNTLGQNASVEANPPNPFLVNWAFDYGDGCEYDWFSVTILGFAAYAGHYTAQNLSSSSPTLRLAPLTESGCVHDVVCLNNCYDSLTFLPRSDEYVINGSGESHPTPALEDATDRSCPEQVIGSAISQLSCGSDNGLLGYWVESLVHAKPSPSFTLFQPGQYTLVAKDLLNQTTFAYFQVA